MWIEAKNDKKEAKKSAAEDLDYIILGYHDRNCSHEIKNSKYNEIYARLNLTITISFPRIQSGVTLGGNRKETGDRHPKIGQGAFIGASVNILRNIKVGRGAIVGADYLVMKDVPPHSIVTGIPEKVIGYVDDQDPSLNMKHGMF
ncbi:hypothetical protein T459_16466 [Capsicum annuum]|uniref:Serine acetyltransferase n=1 Tax=Capsicum annuum TaxID=4072 RepID=A0A2G2Z8X4_CAPAN|nr:hypothetical protein T459_16466 [Capsicum annuum]